MTLKKRFVLMLAIAGFISVQNIRAATILGTGNDVSYAVIQADAFGAPLIFEYHYTYDSGNPFDGYALFNSIDGAVSELTLSWTNFGDETDPNFFLDAITYNSITLTNTAFPAVGPFWAQWVAGGQAGFPTAAPIAEEAWTFGSGFSSPYRLVEPGSWDGAIFNDGTVPPVSPVPEPSATLLILAGLVLFGRKIFLGRWQNAHSA